MSALGQGETAPAAAAHGGPRSALLIALLLAMSAFHLHVVLTGAPQPFEFRGTHLAFALAVIFVAFPTIPARRLHSAPLDALCVAGALGTLGWLIWTQDALYMRFQFVDPPTPMQFWMGVGLTALVLEGARRAIGPALPLTAVAFMVWALATGSLTPNYLVDVLYLSTEGIFGIPLNVSATFLFLFVMFGAFAEKLGVGRFFIEFATALAGRSPGGPAKVASLSSALFGSISGSAVANIMTTGSYTIPLMKRLGYRPAFAGAVEAVASTGGQIMPPVMGAAAFVMAEIMGVGYLTVMTIAAIPAGLFFLSVFVAIHFEAKRQGLRGLDAAAIPRLGAVLAALVLTALAGIVIGMGLPTTPAYILQTALLIPALIRLGVSLEAAHLFALYFACLSAITPPVAIGLFAANAISGARLWPASVAALKLGLTGYIVPFMFVYSPALILQGTATQVALATATAALGVMLLAAGLHGWLTHRLGAPERAMLCVAAILLIFQGAVTDAAGLGLALAAHLIQRRRPATPETAARAA